MTLVEIEADLTELKSLRVQSNRKLVQGFLDAKINELETKIKREQAAVAKPSSPATVTSLAPALSVVKVTNYALDQSDKFMKLYIPIKDAQKIPASNIESSFNEREFSVQVVGLDGVTHSFAMKDLFQDIVPDSCQVKQKSNDVLVMLRKKTEGNWGALTKTEHVEKEKTKPKFEGGDDSNPQSSIINMMKELYDTGDDEMKRNIRKAWHEGQAGRNEKAMPEF